MNDKNIIKPMLLTKKEEPFDDKNYIYELKFDGIRCLIYIKNHQVTIYSRNKRDITKYFPELTNMSINHQVIFDGEIIAFKQNKMNFELLLERINSSKEQSFQTPVCFIAFDILYLDKDLCSLPLLKRKEILNKFKDTNYFVKAKYIFEKGIDLFLNVQKENLEGIVAKKIDSQYFPGERSEEWIKIKNTHIDIFYVCGYEISPLSNKLVLSLAMLTHQKYIYVGKVMINPRSKFGQEIVSLTKTKNYFYHYENNNLNYIKPRACYIKFLNWTNNHHLREPSFIKEVK